MTPHEIGILLHYYTRPVDYDDGDFRAPVVREAIDKFSKAGILKRKDPFPPYPESYEGTDGLRVYVEALCAVPFPELRWVMPNTGEALSRA